MEKFEKVYDVFISYSDKDRKIVSAICNKLENYGIRCWVAYRDIPAGKKWSGAISAAIKRSSILLLVFSSNSNKSNEVEKEIGLGWKHCDTIIPFRIEDIPLSDELEYHLSNVHWLDSLSEPREQQIAELSERIINSLPNRKKEIEEAAKRKIAVEHQMAEAKAKAEAERLAKEQMERQEAEAKVKAEAERLAREEEERQMAEAKAKAEAERLAREEEERQMAEAKAKAEAERLAREEEERQMAEAKAKAEAERFAREEEERQMAEAKAKAEAERFAREEEERQMAEAKAKAEAERLGREEEERQMAEAKALAEAERLAREEVERQKAEAEASPFIEWQDRKAHADVKKNVLKDAGIEKSETGTKEEDNENSTNKDKIKKKKEKEIIYVISKLKFLHFLDTVIVIYSIAALLSLMVNKFVEIPYYTPPTFKTAIFLLTLSMFNKWSKKAKDGSDPAIFSGITYLLFSTPIIYYFTVLITKDWPWILPYSYFVTVPIFWFIIGVFVLGLRDEQFFITRFSTGCIFGFWSAVFYECYKLKHVDLSLGVQEVIGNHGFTLLGFGVICIMFNRASKILSKENNAKKTLTIEKVI